MKQEKVLNQEEVKRLLKIAKTTRHADRNIIVVLLSYLAGLRACEIASLKVGDVFSWQNDKTWEVEQEIRLDSSQTKGSKTQTVVLNSKLRAELREYLQKRPHLRQNPESPLLVTQKRTGFSSQTIQNLFCTLYQSAGIQNASSHSGRRSFITALSEKGVSVRVIQELARHSSMATTKRYIDVSADKLRSAVELATL
jgi:integrase/recombinase XerD